VKSKNRYSKYGKETYADKRFFFNLFLAWCFCIYEALSKVVCIICSTDNIPKDHRNGVKAVYIVAIRFIIGWSRIWWEPKLLPTSKWQTVVEIYTHCKSSRKCNLYTMKSRQWTFSVGHWNIFMTRIM
jgi:hypothetical protein